MAIASAANSKIAYKKETTYGQNPGGNFKYLRFYSDGLTPQTDAIENDEVTSDRLPAGSIVTDIRSQGAIATPWVPNDLDDWLEAALCSAWSTNVSLTGRSIDISGASGYTATLTDAATGAAFANVSVGQVIELGGFNTAANNGRCRVTAKASSNSVTVSGLSFVNVSGETDITLKARMLRAGSTRTSLAIEKQFPDSVLYDLYLGCLVQQFSFEGRLGQPFRVSFDMLGQFPTEGGSSGAGTPTAAGTIDPANVVHNFSEFREGGYGAASSAKINALSFAFGNGVTPIGAFGTLGPVEVLLGRASLSGQLSIWLENWDLATKYRNRTETSLQWTTTWSSGEQYVFTLPAVQLTGCSRVIPGGSGAIAKDIAFAAKKDSAGVAMQIDGPF